MTRRTTSFLSEGPCVGTPSVLALATPQRAATEAGEAAFRKGGNAIDACLAAALSLAVIYPDNCALGGDLIALVGRPDGGKTVINASGAAAAEVDVDLLRRSGDRMALRGAAPVTVPGLIGGLGDLWSSGAALPWAEAFPTAIEQARTGIAIEPSLGRSIATEADTLCEDPGCREIFFDGGVPLRSGDILRQPALGRTLELLAAHGPEYFYRGPLGETLVNWLRSQGSRLTTDDFAAFAPERSEPLVRGVGDMEIATAPPNSQGFLVPLSLSAALRLDPQLDPLGPRAGDLASVFRAGLEVREGHLADPRAPRQGPLVELADVDLLRRQRSPVVGMRRPSGDTVAIVAADDAGNSVSLLQSLFYEFGAGLLDPATGILVHNRGAFFSLDERSPNLIAGRKRPAHTLAPCMVSEQGRTQITIATMGGSAQPQILTEVLLRLRLGDDPHVAIASPRWIVAGASANEVLVEEGVPAAAVRSLEAAGMVVRALPELDGNVGHTELIVHTDGGLSAASDPRTEGSATVIGR